MTPTSAPREVQTYLKRLDRALRPVPRDVASAIRDGIDEELAGLEPAEAIERVRSFDEPESIAAAALGESRTHPTPAGRARVIWIVASGAVVVLAVALVSTWALAPGPTPEATSSSVVAYPMPDLGPSPAPTPLAPDEQEQLRIQEQDRQWEGVLAGFPDATRPADPFQEYRDPNDSTALLGCLTAAGLTVDLGSNAAGGGPVSIMTSASTEAESVAAFTCWSSYPTTPVVPMTSEQIDYLYSYLTEYLVPCYEANGIENPDAPSRTDFIDQWPNQGWFPSTSEAWLTDDEQEAIDEACTRPI
ncbi:hypothetical protein C5C95_05685 [Rathayibacter sp. AY1B7]|nr:hypothetical protein C5C95_05685 [Rathayibacter sp. AY1B7]